MNRLTLPTPAIPLLLLATACNNPPRALITPGAVDFGSVKATQQNTPCPQGTSVRTETLTVTSPRNGLGYRFAVSPGDFSWEPDTMLPQTFPKGTSTYQVGIRFTPTHTGDQTALASIILADPEGTASIIDLKGRGVCEF